jgi:hypothetical protein
MVGHVQWLASVLVSFAHFGHHPEQEFGSQEARLRIKETKDVAAVMHSAAATNKCQ